MLRPGAHARLLAALAAAAIAASAAALLAGGCVSEPVRETPERAEAAAASPAVGPVWQWLGTRAPDGSVEVDEPERYTLRLVPGGHARIRLDCSRGGGPYAVRGERLVLGELLSTREDCPPDSLDARYERELDRVRSFRVEGGRLYLELAGGGGTMRFRRRPDDPSVSAP